MDRRTGGERRGGARADRPAKPCAACGRPVAWRKKWETVWDQVRYCSARCRRGKAGGPAPATPG